MVVITWPEGERKTLNPGQQMCGQGIQEIVSMTFEDTSNPCFNDWFSECVHTRMMPRDVMEARKDVTARKV
jgi:hypothetical protein